MNTLDWHALQPLDVLRHKGTGQIYVLHRPVHHRDGSVSYTLAQVMDASNPAEWERVDEIGQVIEGFGKLREDRVR